jgi:hypothetical protein
MAWVKITDDFYDHDKFLTLTPPADSLWMRSLAWANRRQSDGHLPVQALTNLFNPNGLVWSSGEAVTLESVADELVATGLWEESPTGAGYQIHDYLDYQPSKADLTGKREASRQRMQKARSKSQTGVQGDGSQDVAAQHSRNEVATYVQPPLEASFEAFWAAYPKKVAKATARKAWPEVVTSVGVGGVEIILTGARDYADAVKGSDPKFIPHPSKWLGEKRWEDDLSAVAGQKLSAFEKNVARMRARKAAES